MNVNHRTRVELREALENLLGVRCWSALAGPSTGSVIHLHLGKKVRRPRKLRNEWLSDDERTFQGEFRLYVECVWRLDSTDKVICGAWDDNSREGPMLQGLSELEESSIESLELSAPGLDLVLRFSEGRSLKIFCDQVNEADQADNYTLVTPTREFTVGWKSSLHMQVRDSVKLHTLLPPEDPR